MSLSFFFFLLLLLSYSPLLGAEPDPCRPRRCRRRHGPLIRFPFRLRDRHPAHPQNCSYPGFDLYCNDKKETILILPLSVNLIVRKIDYKSQTIHLSDPENCLARKLQSLKLPSSPFNFWSDNSYDTSVSDFILFNCSSSAERNDRRISCLSDTSYGLYPVRSNSDMDSESVTSCPRSQSWTAGSLLFLTALAALIFFCVSIIKDRKNRKKIEKFLEDYRALKPTRFCYSDIRRITNQFSEKLGEGGFGVVYKAKLSSEIFAAVKVLNNSKENGEEFVNEVSTIGRIHHVNVVRLLGFCAEGFRRVLVYEFLPNESLEKIIFQQESKKISLGWEKLHDIALGIAKGIEYLHQGCDQQILHFDIKPHNILLDQNYSPKICDFGLAKLCSREQSAVTMTAARGTMGYIAPELLSRTFGKVSYKSDVYSFGMLLLEMVGGRKNVDTKVENSQAYFPQWIFNHLNLDDEFWAQIKEGDHGSIARRLTIVGLHCIQWYPADRPSMKMVVQMLEGDGSDLTIPADPFPTTNETSMIGVIPKRPFQLELPLILENE